ncbi:S-layer homology domain-containing protein [Sporosarcina sp. FSL W7-1283]|uniref:S-layer homology domain-containing protein n=1 Tax=Sporosarcina sp. FSL W7-1283 TaxID=2921560 RepID=UPI0030FC1B60
MRKLFGKIKVVLFISLLFVLITLASLSFSHFGAAVQDQRFSDIDNTFWAKDEVMQLADEGIIAGYPDFQFRPSAVITRGQAANLLASALQLPDTPYEPIFTDVSQESSFLRGAMATYQEKIFAGKPDGAFGVSDPLTREQMASAIVSAFNLKNTGTASGFTDENEIGISHKQSVNVLKQYGITTGKEDGSFDPKSPVTRATFAVFLHRTMIQSGALKERAAVKLTEPETIGPFEAVPHSEQFIELPLGEECKVFLRSDQQLQLIEKRTQAHGHATDQMYTYSVNGQDSVTMTVVKRQLPNSDYFLFTELRNPETTPIRIDLVQTEDEIKSNALEPFSKFSAKKEVKKLVGEDVTTFPVGLLETVTDDKISQELIGKSYRSRELEINYAQGSSRTREFLAEEDVYSSIVMGGTRVSVFVLQSHGDDVTDQWLLSSGTKLFSTDEQRDNWMHEFALHSKKRNQWYTAKGAYSKMAETVEPIAASGHAYGRNLLMMKEDRAMELYQQTQERFYEDLLHNAFVNLQLFKGEEQYWETEVTSTYLKDLYGFTAPFIDTRFNEQIALFLNKAGNAFEHPDASEGLRNYADLLVAQQEKGNISGLKPDAYYIPDYFPVRQKVVTHTSMNHQLGGMNILLLAYQEFGDTVYLETASAIEKAIALEEKSWIRDDGDIWYKRTPDGEFAGRDYTHLTLEDLIDSYENWLAVDEAKTPVFKRMIESKAGYLDKNKKGYTTKIKEGLKRIDMSNLLPNGIEHTDAL